MATATRKTSKPKEAEAVQVNTAKDDAVKALDKLARAGGLNSQWTAAWEAYKAAQ